MTTERPASALRLRLRRIVSKDDHSGSSQIDANGSVVEDHSRTASPIPSKTPRESVQAAGDRTSIDNSHSNATEAPPPPPSTHRHLRRPHLRSRTSSEKVPPAPAQNDASQPSQADAAKLAARRPSWISSLSSRFSSSASSPTHDPPVPIAANGAPETPKDDASSQPPHAPTPTPSGPEDDPATESDEEEEEGERQSTPQPQKKEHPSFFSNALRRLSSAPQVPTPTKPPCNGAACKRRILNVDPNRERCQVHELDQTKLKRVAFCVDVEIAGASRYVDSEEQSTSNGPSLESTDATKKMDLKLKERGEGEALMDPAAVTEQKELDGVVSVSAEEVGTADSPNPQGTVEVKKEEPSRKKEKKKRSEEERKERKEKRRKEAEANGIIPVEFVRSSEDSAASSIPKSVPPSKLQDRPTTDPARIYRRCCQLRESGILKKITEQLSAPSSCAVGVPGLVNSLDLSGYWMPFPDVITLGDYLAVVPVKKLVLEDCGLTDEGVRIVLAGLLAVKAPICGPTGEIADFKHGAIEKLSFKNNPKIGREGWRHISLFINMSHSLRAVDLSRIPFPRLPHAQSGGHSNIHKTTSGKHLPADMSCLLSKAISGRVAGSHLEELALDDCGLETAQIGKITEACTARGLKRLGLASNNLTAEGLAYVSQFVQSGKCEGLDLAGNNLRDTLHIFSDALNEKSSIYALSLADCDLLPSSLSTLLPALVTIPNFRFIDLSHNKELFKSDENALKLLREFLPQMRKLKRIHLADVSLTAEHAISLSEVLPETPSIAHLNLLENPQISALASATDESSQEEACALYASLMAAVRASRTIVSIDIDVPCAETNEVVQALAKQVVAYCLRNMEHGPVAEAIEKAGDDEADDKQVAVSAVPDILLSLLGHFDDFPENHDDDEPAPDDDYVIGGTGLVKALGVCLGNRSSDSRRPSRASLTSENGFPFPADPTKASRKKAKDVSVTLLDSARKIRSRLQQALLRESKFGDEMGHHRLLFLDNTLERMIERFEDEYPECRCETPAPPEPPLGPTEMSDSVSIASSLENLSLMDSGLPAQGPAAVDADVTIVEPAGAAEEHVEEQPAIRRHASEVSLASRALSLEEGRMHRFGQRMKRDIFRSQDLEHEHHDEAKCITAGESLHKLREKLEAMDGDEIKEKVMRLGAEEVLREIGVRMEEIHMLEREDPESFQKFREAQLITQLNTEGPPCFTPTPAGGVIFAGGTPAGGTPTGGTPTGAKPAGGAPAGGAPAAAATPPVPSNETSTSSS
ncbi:MAG: hypothetical protein M1819_007381 [Sarea resinae]|nr:MAG: hypothetical protein M1819_007381 [Sarea resinae]